MLIKGRFSYKFCADDKVVNLLSRVEIDFVGYFLKAQSDRSAIFVCNNLCSDVTDCCHGDVMLRSRGINMSYQL
jgi:hypothetical protein